MSGSLKRLEEICTALPCAGAGSWIRNRASGTWTGVLTWDAGVTICSLTHWATVSALALLTQINEIEHFPVKSMYCFNKAFVQMGQLQTCTVEEMFFLSQGDTVN